MKRELMLKASAEKELEFILNLVRTQIDQSQKLCIVFRKLTPGEDKRRYRKLEFPASSFGKSRNFVITLRVCSIILENFKRKKIVPVRDIYYQDVSLFKTQQTVVRAVERLSKLFCIPREMLNITQSPNGLVSADMTIALKNGEVREIRRANGISFVPVEEIMYARCIVRPQFILVIEKEAVFSNLSEELPGGVLLTGKGFPDNATRRLVAALTLTYPEIPIFGLVDSDPHGILILHTYDQGPKQEFDYRHPLELKYLGVSLLDYTEGLVPMTINDIKVARSTLTKDWIHEPRYALHKRELQRGLFMLQKGEMNILDRSDTLRLAEYARRKMKRYHDFHESTPKRVKYTYDQT